MQLRRELLGIPKNTVLGNSILMDTPLYNFSKNKRQPDTTMSYLAIYSSSIIVITVCPECIDRTDINNFIFYK